MPSLQTQYKLADLLKSIAEGEKQVEIVRQVLAEKVAFEPYTAFKRIDRNSNSYITVYELVDFLRENDVAVLERDVSSLFKEYDTNRDDRLSYTEFLNIVLPKTSSVLRQICTQRESYIVNKDEVLPYEVEWALARVFEKEIDLITRAELLKKDLADRYDFDALDLFRTIDEERVGAIDFDLLYVFFKKNGVSASETEILALLRRGDKNVDGKLTYSEFYNTIVNQGSYRATSPVRKSSRVASPIRNKSSTRMTNSTYFANTAGKLSNYDYLDYVHTSQRSARSRSPTLNRSNNFNKSGYVATSPVRDSLTKRIQESNKELAMSDLSTSVNASVYRTPTKKVASPYRGRSPLRESLARSRSPLRESLYRSRSPVRSPVRSPTRTTLPRETLSPMKGNEEQYLANALKEQIELDKELENVKVDLALRRDFNLFDAFKFFDLEGNGSITKKDLKDGLNEFGSFPTSDELYLIMRKFDRDGDGLLRFSDFTDMLTPKEGGYAEILNKRVPSYAAGAAINEIFAEQTLFLLKKTLNMVIKNEVYSESIRQRLNRRPLFNLWEGFKALDKDNNGFVSTYEFKDMLINHGFFPSQKEVLTLVDRYDKNHDGKVSYSEFIQEITPKSPQKY